MPYTTHGHWYGPGEPTQPGPRLVAKCGGPAICYDCSVQAGGRRADSGLPTAALRQRPGDQPLPVPNGQPGQDVPDELLQLAAELFSSWYGQDLDFTGEARTLLAAVLPAHEAMVLKRAEITLYARLVEQHMAERMAEIEQEVRARVAEEIEVKAAKVAAEAETYVNNNLQGETALELRERAGYLIEAACIARGTS
jgi:ferredoxin